MKKDTKLYNVLFPLWMLLLFPQMWLVVLPGNFIIDSLVLLILMFAVKLEEKRRFYVKTIWKIYLFGLLSDVIGALYLLLMMVGFNFGRMGDEPYLTVPALIISAVAIYFFNYFVSFKKCEKKTRIAFSLTFAIATAPYTFLIPSGWIYGW